MHDFEKTPPEALELLRKPIRDLGLRLEGSTVERYVLQLHEELQTAGLLHFKPACYLTDEWGCPSGEPVIGIPFYLADPKLAALEKAMNDIEDEHEIMMYLRHEAGHAFNYAYEFYKRPAWREQFGPFRRAYRDDYRPIPFSRRFVRHIAGWYAQKHPDEDFAETFAVWLTPGSEWRVRYEGWTAFRKLNYMDGLCSEVASVPPVRPLGEVDYTVNEMDATVEEFYRSSTLDEEREVAELPLQNDVADIFSGRPRAAEPMEPAEFFSRHRKTIIDKVTYWTGLRRQLVKRMLEAIEKHAVSQKVILGRDQEQKYVIEVTAYATALAMNFVARGKFIQT